MKFKAAVLVALKQPLEVTELELSTLTFGQVLVAIRCSGICGSQLGEIDGAKGNDPYLPHLLGHEACAEVLEVGPGVKRVAPGQRVVLHWRKAAGIEADPPQYRWGERKVNAGWVTTLQTHAIVSENRVTPIGADVPEEVAALMGCAVTTGMGVVTSDARLTIGESILVLGAGGVGLSVIQAARLAGACPVVAVDRFPNRLELARRLGADETIEASDAEQLLAPGKGYDVVVESTGYVPFIEAAYRLAQPQGRVVLVGVPRAGDSARLYTLPLHFGKVLTGSHGGGTEPDRDIPRYLRLYAARRLDLESLVSRRYTLDEVNVAIAAMRAGELVGRCMVWM